MRLTETLRKAIARAIIQDMPKPDNAKRAAEIIKKIDAAITPEVKRFHKKYPGVCKKGFWVSFTDPIYGNGSYVFTGDLTEKQIADILRPYESEEEARREAKRQLEATLKGFSTTQQIAKAFPEFEKYLPTEAQPTKNLPALTNVVSDLAKLGWPKGGVK